MGVWACLECVVVFGGLGVRQRYVDLLTALPALLPSIPPSLHPSIPPSLLLVTLSLHTHLLEHIGGAFVVLPHVGHEKGIVAKGVRVVGVDVERSLEEDLATLIITILVSQEQSVV